MCWSSTYRAHREPIDHNGLHGYVRDSSIILPSHKSPHRHTSVIKTLTNLTLVIFLFCVSEGWIQTARKYSHPYSILLVSISWNHLTSSSWASLSTSDGLTQSSVYFLALSLDNLSSCISSSHPVWYRRSVLYIREMLDHSEIQIQFFTEE